MLLPLRARLAAVLRRDALLRLLLAAVRPLLRLPPRPLLDFLVVDLLPIPELLDEPRLLAMATPWEKGREVGPHATTVAPLRTSGKIRPGRPLQSDRRSGERWR